MGFNLALKGLTTFSRALHEKLIVPHLVKKFTAFCGTRQYITGLTTAHHLALACLLKIPYNIILPSSPKSSVRKVSAPEFCMHMYCSPGVPHDPPISFSLTWYQTNSIRWTVEIMNLLTVRPSPAVRSLSLLGPNIVLSEVVRELLRIGKIHSWVHQIYCNVIWHKTVVWVGTVFCPRRAPKLHYRPNRLTEVKVLENGGTSPHSLHFGHECGWVLGFRRLYTRRKNSRRPLIYARVLRLSCVPESWASVKKGRKSKNYIPIRNVE